MSNPVTIDQIISHDILVEVISYFPLYVLESDVRKVSHSFHSACDKHKKIIFNHLQKSGIVEILGTETERLNGQVGYNDKGVRYDDNGACFVQVAGYDRFTGIASHFRVSPKNLNPFVSQSRAAAEHEMIQGLNPTLPEPINCIFSFFIHNLRIASDMAVLDQDDPNIVDVATAMIPPHASRWKGTQIFNCLEEKLEIFSRDNLCQRCEIGSKFHPDGPNGKLMREFVKFVQSWPTEKIEMTLYYYAKRERGGAVLVAVTQWGLKRVCVAKLPKYSVPGITEPPPGTMVTATLVPVKDILVCTYLQEVNGFNIVTGLHELSEYHIREKIQKGEVITCGESSSRGLWTSDP